MSAMRLRPYGQLDRVPLDDACRPNSATTGPNSLIVESLSQSPQGPEPAVAAAFGASLRQRCVHGRQQLFVRQHLIGVPSSANQPIAEDAVDGGRWFYAATGDQKADQEGAPGRRRRHSGDPARLVVCPVAALRAWLELSQIVAPAAFARHSLRAGLVTHLRSPAGVPICSSDGKSLHTLRGFVRSRGAYFDCNGGLAGIRASSGCALGGTTC
jgi:hypothetical protein